MKYKPGQSGNPNGRPPGILNKRTHLVRLFEEGAEDVIQKVKAMAMDGNMDAIKIWIDRIVPKIREEAENIRIIDVDVERVKKLLIEHKKEY